VSDATAQALAEVRAIAADAGITPVLPVHVLVGKVLADLPAIGKNQRNGQQGYSFRGIDDVLDALNPILSDYGVFILPSVLERVAEVRTTNNNKPLYTVHLHVAFRIYGPGGDHVEGSAWGEGTDSGDKATSKAMTMAFKYFLFEAFAISTEEQRQADNDRHTAPETVHETIPSATQRIVRQSCDQRGITSTQLDLLVREVTDNRSDDLADVRPGDEYEELKARIKAWGADAPVLALDGEGTEA
jgi:hypothetical protein